jgi:hypothetical protein
LSSFDESLVVQEDEAQGKEGEQVRENEVEREIRVGIRYQVKPVWLFVRRFVLRLERAPIRVIVIFISNTDVILWTG